MPLATGRHTDRNSAKGISSGDDSRL